MAVTVAYLSCFGPISHPLGAAVLDLGTLPNTSESSGLGITDSGRAGGACTDRAFRTAPNSPIFGGSDSVHDSLVALIPPVSHSRAYDIWQTQTKRIEVVGEFYNITLWRPFWYYEDPNTGYKYARVLHQGTGAAYSVEPGFNGSAVAGFIDTNNFKRAALWSVSLSQHALYVLGEQHFPNEDSVATRTDGVRTVGYRGSEPFGHAFVVSGGSAYSLQEPFGAIGSAALGIWTPPSSSTYIAGYYHDGTYQKPIFWYFGGGGSIFVTLNLPAGKTQGIARSVNNAGNIVGSAWTDGTDEVACLWNTSGAVTVMNSLSGDSQWNLIRADDIQTDYSGRRIVGTGMHLVNGTWYSRAFVLYNW